MHFRISILFLLFSVQLFGQDYALKEAQIRDGYNTYLLSSSAFVDKDRFVWYATNRDGDFYRFDGKNKLRYQFYKNENSYGDSFYICNNAWIQDHKNNIWAAELDKAYIITPDKLLVERIQYPSEKLSSKSFIAKDEVNNLWISNGSRFLIKITPDRQVIRVTHPLLNDKNEIEIIKVLDNGRIIAKSGYNIFYVDTKGIHFSANIHTIDKAINSEFAIFENGKIVAENSSGYYKYNNSSYKYVYLKELNIQLFNYPYEENCLLGNCNWSNSTLIADSKFLVTDNSSLFINQIDKKTNQITTTDTLHFKKQISIANNKLHSNFIWISAYDELYKLLIIPNNFKRILQSDDKQYSTRGIVSDSKNNLYIGTYEGLYKQENNKKPVPFLVKGEKNGAYDILILEKNDSILWGSQEYSSLKKINLTTHTKKEIGLPKGFKIEYMKEKSPDELWMGSNKGMYVFSKKTETISPFNENGYFLGTVPVLGFIEAKDGKKWFATRQGLFLKEKGKDFINYQKLNPTFNFKDLLTLHEDDRGNLWMSTGAKGIIFLDPKTNRFKNLTQSDGLSNNTVCGILESKEAMWFSTYYGLTRFDKKEGFFALYYKEDGLSDNEFNVRSSYKKDENTFYFGGLNGIIEFNPANIKLRGKHPHTIFLYSSTYFSNERNKNVTDYLSLHKKTISLPYNKNYFSAVFSINELFYIEKNTYLYKIEGLRNEWIDAGTSGLVELPSLPPGDYVLRVKGKDAKGIETLNEIKINLHVEQIFYKTPFFIILIALLVIGSIIYFFFRRNRRQKRIFEREKEIKELKSSALRAQMNPHFVFNILNNMQSVLILKGEAEANKYFGAFSKLFRQTLDISRQELITLKSEIEYLNNYLLLNNLQLNDELEYSVNVQNSVGDTSTIFLPGMLIQPFVENAILHGLSPKQDKKLTIDFSMEEGYLVVIVEDNGIGRTMATENTLHKKEAHKSWATTIVNERINIMNYRHNTTKAVILKIDDLEKNGNPCGTRVTLKLQQPME
ncbi:histidine kinase [Flavobacterium lindanitolerans]|uniref:YXYXY domain-containing protein n=1 Tax=Flavobacterium lindanitolerans TaxID=428988 RepID=A0A497UI49_9FLAO|nr:histidine kinase [Flavobacterium lindanitolerans]PKW21140.1 YXYXY domain-containing protein [Flavobacterium lindanitolerans]RLJ30222.1 YXYXY domain-containing protein [Flavobacterium lindanitolerans]